MTQHTTALITGGGRGVGRAIALRLAQLGAHVTVAARSEAERVETTLARRARDQLGRVDILVRISEAACVRLGR